MSRGDNGRMGRLLCALLGRCNFRPAHWHRNGDQLVERCTRCGRWNGVGAYWPCPDEVDAA